MDDTRAIPDEMNDLERHADQVWQNVEIHAVGDLALDTLCDIIVDCKSTGEILRANAAFHTLTGLPEDQITGRPADSFELLKDRGTPRCVVKLVAKDGTEFWFDRAQIKMRDTDSGEVFIRIIGRNITAHKQAEAALDEARKHAEDADSAKSRFLAMVSHEIRTPLNGISGMSNLLSDTQLSAEQKNYVEAIASSSQALLLLVNDLLQFGREDISARHVRSEITSIAPLVAGVVELLAGKAHAKNIDLGYGFSEGLPEKLKLDAGRLRQILFNIIGNAVKFTCKGGVRIDVEYNDRNLNIRVKDTGPGIAAEHMDTIFMPFEQVENTFSRTHDGAGLGLSIARKMARAMGGDILLESTAGNGSVFTVTINAYPAADTQAKSFQMTDETVLLCMRGGVEAELLAGCIRATGSHVIHTDKIEEARQLARQWPYPSKFIIDQRLTSQPVEEQIEDAASDCQLIALITPEQRGSIGAGFKAAGQAFLTRPVRPSTARRVIMNIENLKSNSHTEPNNQNAAGPAAHKKILLAEDNPINALLARKLLEGAGYEVKHVTDGLQAVDIFSRDRDIDIILMDLHMPVMDGMAAIKAIRQNEEERNAPSVPLFAISADTQKTTIDAIIAAGASGILEKPLQVDALNNKLADFAPLPSVWNLT